MTTIAQSAVQIHADDDDARTSADDIEYWVKEIVARGQADDDGIGIDWQALTEDDPRAEEALDRLDDFWIVKKRVCEVLLARLDRQDSLLIALLREQWEAEWEAKREEEKEEETENDELAAMISEHLGI